MVREIFLNANICRLMKMRLIQNYSIIYSKNNNRIATNTKDLLSNNSCLSPQSSQDPANH